MKCPFIYPNGKQCSGYIESLEVANCLRISLNESDKITRKEIEPRQPVLLYCSLKRNHRGVLARHPKEMKKIWHDLPESIKNEFEQ